MKYQNLLSGKNKKNVSSAELAQGMVKVEWKYNLYILGPKLFFLYFLFQNT